MIMNFFQKSGISTENQETTIAEDNYPFRELLDEIVAEIIAELLETECVSDYDNYCYSGEVADEPVKYPDKNGLLQFIETLHPYASRIESQVDQYFAKKKQTSIRDFLNKK